MDLSNGDIHSSNLDNQYNQAGNLVWSPDQTLVAFCQANAGFVEKDLFSLAVITVESMDITELLPMDAQFKCPTQWLDEDRLRLNDFEGHKWIYDFRSGKLLD